ncbi:MAG: tyrosine-type recombinase/integrase [Candidatus Latescibacterota bacterium]|nr:tyrosine-type recombinase/integrase [Candidatus Latescibacterota bacterium]
MPSGDPSIPHLTPISGIEIGVDVFVAELEKAGSPISEATRQAYESDLRQFARFLHTVVAGPTVTSIEVGAVRAFCNHLQTQGRGPRTLARKLASVRALHRFLQKRDLSSVDPTAGVKLPGMASDSAGLARDDVETLMCLPDESYLGTRDRAILELLYGTGIRLSELLALNLSSVDVEAASIHVIGPRQRTVPLGVHAVSAIRSYLRQRAEALLDRQVEDLDVGALFLSSRGRRLRSRSVQRIVERYLLKLTARDGGAHGPGVLRSAFAEHLTESGADAAGVAALLGTQNATATGTSADPQGLRERYLRAHPRV